MNEQEKIAELIELLKSRDWEIRNNAVTDLVAFGNVIITPLFYAYQKNPMRFFSDNVTQVVKSIGEPAILSLAELLQNSYVNGEARFLIFRIFQAFMGNDLAIDTLLEMATNEKTINLKDEAISCLGFSKREDVFDFLMKIAKEETGWTQERAIMSLGIFRDKRATNALIELLRSPKFHNRHRAIISLGQIGDKEATDELIKILSEDDDYLTKYYVIEALNKVEDAKALSVLQEFKQTFDRASVASLQICLGPSFEGLLDMTISKLEKSNNSS